jgi:hypothetical protein
MNIPFESSLMNRIENASRFEQQTMSDAPQLKQHSLVALSLDESGIIRECDSVAEMVFGYLPHELYWQHISCLFPTLADVALMQGNQLNPMLNYICHCDHYFEAIDKQENIIICHLNFVLVENEGRQNLRMIVRPVPNARS